MRARRCLAAGFAALVATAGALVVAAPVSPAGAVTTTVTNIDDDGSDTSLRYLVQTANDGDVLELVAGATYELDICGDRQAAPDVAPELVLSTGELWVFSAVTIHGNGATIAQTCPGSRVLLTEADLTLTNVTITGGTATSGGGGIRVNDIILSEGGAGAADTDTQLVIVNSSIVGNCTTSNGGGIKMNTNGDVVVVNSTIAGNRGNSVGGGISHSHEGDVTLVNSTVTENTSYDHAGLDVRNGNLTAVYSDIVGNVTGLYSDGCGLQSGAVEEDDGDIGPATIEAANVYVSATFEFVAFGTVVAEPGEADNCSAVTSSSGYNFADDETCGFDALGDRQGTTLDPMLGALASNGGPTQTLLPATGSPLIDAIPDADCAIADTLLGESVSTDQRLLPRPDVVNQTCDVGSVEIQTEPVVIEPTFTG